MTVKNNSFETLNKIDVSAHIEKKGQFSYLSWPWAVQQLRSECPDSTWEVIKHDGKPFIATECGYFVEVAVAVNGLTLSQVHPVLDNKNQTISKPNAFQINTSIQRCLVKAIALHGLGLCVYAGEDLPMVEQALDPNVSALIDSCATLNDLKSIWKNECKENSIYLDLITLRKQELSNENNE